MNWKRFKHHGEADTAAFESLCVQLFEKWCQREFKQNFGRLFIVNGAGGDGGVEAYLEQKDGSIIGVQAKCFFNSIDTGKIGQIRGSFLSAVKLRKKIVRYIVCVPRDLGNEKTTGIDHEQKRWDELVSELKVDYPSVDLELWNETKILNELQLPENEGVYQYWFEKEEFTLNLFKERYALQKKAWIKNPYVPILHCMGEIQQSAEALLLLETVRNDIQIKAKKVLGLIRNLESELTLAKETVEILPIKFIPDINHTLKNLLEYKERCEILESASSSSDIIGSSTQLQAIDFDTIYTFLASNTASDYYIKNAERYDLKKAIDNFEIVRPHLEIESMTKLWLQQLLLVLGDQGTGKTHSLLHISELHNNCELPCILIKAKDVTAKEGWGQILKRNLGLSDTWSEKEIFSALQSSAIRAKVNLLRRTQTFFSSFVLIAIDGLEESLERDEWSKRLRELDEILPNYQFIKVIATGRPYFYTNDDEKPRIAKVHSVNDKGDVPAHNLFLDYIKYYNIQTDEVPWVRWALKTPLALKLFCEHYGNQDKVFSGEDKVITTISELLKAKIYKIDNEICNGIQGKWNSSIDRVLMRSLITMTDSFLNHGEVDRVKAIHCIQSGQSHPNLVNYDQAGQILDLLVDYGILNKKEQVENGILEVLDPIYTPSNPPLIDYLTAQKVVSIVTKNVENRTMPTILHGQIEARKLAAIQLFVDHGIMVGDESYWANLDEETLNELRLTVLANVDSQRAFLYMDWVIDMFTQLNTNSMVMKNLIYPLSRMITHTFSAQFMHNMLLRYPNMFERDVVWKPSTFIKLNLESLDKEDTYTGLPLIYAWSLAMEDTQLKMGLSLALTKWGIDSFDQYLNLLNFMISCNDIQIIRELLVIGYSVVCRPYTNAENVRKLADWIIEVFYSKKNNINYYDILIMQSCRTILNKAYEIYKSELYQWEVIFESLECIRLHPKQESISDQLFDLIQDHKNILDPFFYQEIEDDLEVDFCLPYSEDFIYDVDRKIYGNIDTEVKEEVKSLIHKVDLKESSRKHRHVKDSKKVLTNEGYKFIQEDGISDVTRWTEFMLTDFLISLGFDEQKHLELIKFSNKYFNCVEYELQGYIVKHLANIAGKLSKDYLEFVKIKHLFQEINEKEYFSDDWILPNNIYRFIGPKEKIAKKNLSEWLKYSTFENLNEWLIISDNDSKYSDPSKEWVVLFGGTTILEREMTYGLGKIELFTNALICDKNKFNLILRDCQIGAKEAINQIKDAWGYEAVILGDKSLQTRQHSGNVIHMDLQEENSSITCNTIDYLGKITSWKYYATRIIKRPLLNDTLDTIFMPSAIIRDALEINFGDNTTFTDAYGTLLGFTTKAGTRRNMDEYQTMLLIDKSIIHQLDQMNLKLFWVVQGVLQPSHKGEPVLYKKGRPETGRNQVDMLFWLEDNTWKHHTINSDFLQ